MPLVLPRLCLRVTELAGVRVRPNPAEFGSAPALGLAIWFLAFGFCSPSQANPPSKQPNVLLIITDDQGYGDLSFHGNPILKTPHLDAFAKQSVQVRNFYVSPVCAPTRASLLTGRYHHRTGVVDTYLGRALMRPEEVTLAELLASAGYRTGIFGKWHLGDNYPLRAMDQGFQESLVLKGGGIGQPSDPPGGESYFDPLLLHNGRWTRTKGYCSDVFTDAAMRFMEADSAKPFFCYLAFNAPHTPLQVPERYERLYGDADWARFPKVGQPVDGIDATATAKVYGMITSIDDNLGRLFARLEARKLSANTIVVFLTDNGPQQPRYNSGLRGRKGSVYEGGIRVPCFIRWPERLHAGRQLERIAAHIDIVPTLLEACGALRPEKLALDGRSLMPLLKGEQADWPERALFFQWHRGDVPEPGRAFAVRHERWKLVQARGVQSGPFKEEPRFELFDLLNDPFEQNDLAAKHPGAVELFRRQHESWLRLVGEHGFAPPRIHLGSPHENPTELTRQDWRGPRAGWGASDLGHWEVHVARAGEYRIALRFADVKRTGVVHLKLGDVEDKRLVAEGQKEALFERLRLAPGDARLEAWRSFDKVGGDLSAGGTVGVHQVEVRRLEQ